MGADSEIPVLVCQDILTRLQKDIELPDGTSVPKGTLVLLLPQTMAECVMTPEGKSLADLWDSFSRNGHTHPELVQYSEQLIRFSTRLAAVEAKLPQN